MSSKTKRKHVFREVLEDDMDLPSENQTIVKILSTKGNNLHEVLDPSGLNYLVSMPTKFRKNVWIKRGNYVLVEPIEEGDKVKAEIVGILTNEHVKHFKKEKVWPSEFEEKKEVCDETNDFLVNTNRLHLEDESSSDSSQTSDEE